MAASSTKGVVSITNVAPTVALMRRYGAGFTKMVRDDVQSHVAPMVVAKVSSAASGSSSQGAAVAATFKVIRDRFPAFRGFGSSAVTSTGVQAGNIGFGANWGGGNRRRSYSTVSPSGLRYSVTRATTHQFGGWTGGGSSDHFIYSTIARNRRAIDDAWQDALDRAYKEWNR